MRLVQDWGINDMSRGTVFVNGKPIKSYSVWNSMITRCHSAKQLMKDPTYKGVKIHPSWKYFSNFKRWFDVNYIEGFSLDKDLLIQGSKRYSPATCTFVPQSLNALFTDSAAIRGLYPIGVSWHKRDCHFRCHLNENGKRKHIGSYHTVEEASVAYQIAKREYVLSEMERYRVEYPDNEKLMMLIDVVEDRWL